MYLDTAATMIESTVAGFNATIFAYGQTSSGKTHTMYGSSSGEQGVIGMAVDQLFFAMENSPNRKFLMMVSYFLFIPYYLERLALLNIASNDKHFR